MRKKTSLLFLLMICWIVGPTLGYGDDSTRKVYPNSLLTDHIKEFGKNLGNLNDPELLTRCLLTLDYMEKYRDILYASHLKLDAKIRFQSKLLEHRERLINSRERLKNLIPRDEFKSNTNLIESIIFRISQHTAFVIKESASGLEITYRGGNPVKPENNPETGQPVIVGVSVGGGSSTHMGVPGADIKVIETDKEYIVTLDGVDYRFPKSLLVAFPAKEIEGISRYPDEYSESQVTILETLKRFALMDPEKLKTLLSKINPRHIDNLKMVTDHLNQKKIFKEHEKINLNLDKIDQLIKKNEEKKGTSLYQSPDALNSLDLTESNVIDMDMLPYVLDEIAIPENDSGGSAGIELDFMDYDNEIKTINVEYLRSDPTSRKLMFKSLEKENKGELLLIPPKSLKKVKLKAEEKKEGEKEKK